MSDETKGIIGWKTIETEFGKLTLQVVDDGARNSGGVIIQAVGDSELYGKVMSSVSQMHFGAPEERIEKDTNSALKTVIDGCLVQWRARKSTMDVFHAFKSK